MQKMKNNKDADVELMLKVKDGDHNAFTLLEQRYKKEIRSLFYKNHNHNPHNGQEADDYAQEVFLRLWDNRERYEPKAGFRTYLYTIANNLSKNLWKKNRKMPKIVSPNDDDNPIDIVDEKSLNPYETFIQKEENIQLQEAIHSLPEKQREVFRLRYFRDLPCKEIAKILKCSLNTVYSRKRLSEKKLTEKLKKEIFFRKI